MRAPPLVLTAALLSWGWQTGYLPYAVIMALLLELPHWLNWRTNIRDQDFNRLSDLGGLIFTAVVIYMFINYSAHGIFKILEVAPLTLFPLILAQQYSRQGKIKSSALFLSMRKLDKTVLADYPDALDISLPYVFICLLAASAGNKTPQLFFLILCLFFASILWHTRPGQYRPLQWCLPALLAFTLAFLSQAGLTTLQTMIEQNISNWFDRFSWQARDINRATTAIGTLGRLKLSDRVALRIESEKPAQPPLLHEASYSSYKYGVWSNAPADFTVIDKNTAGANWIIHPHTPPDSAITIAGYFDDKQAILPAPYGTLTLAGGNILELSKSPHNSLRAESKPGWTTYRIHYSGGHSFAPAPAEADLIVPDNHLDDFRRLAETLNLDQRSEWEIIHAVDTFFAENFRYSIVQNQRYPKGRYLTNFLFKDRKGHCEYFATATALLLRTAGIPARYAVGFSPHEYSPWQKTHLVRARDAHSWTTFYLDNQWHIIDTTPAIWASMESADNSALTGLFDLISWLRYKLSQDHPAEDKQSNHALILLLIPLILYLLRSFIPTISNKTPPATNRAGKHPHGADSAFYTLITRLEQAAGKRKPGETLLHWLARILPEAARKDYLTVAKLHYLYRFGLPAEDHIKKQLARKVSQLLQNTAGAAK